MNKNRRLLLSRKLKGRRNVKHRYNYLYSKEELKPWAEKVKQISLETPVVRGYFNNHYGAKAVVNALQFRDVRKFVIRSRKTSFESCSRLLPPEGSPLSTRTSNTW